MSETSETPELQLAPEFGLSIDVRGVGRTSSKLDDLLQEEYSYIIDQKPEKTRKKSKDKGLITSPNSKSQKKAKKKDRDRDRNTNSEKMLELPGIIPTSSSSQKTIDHNHIKRNSGSRRNSYPLLGNFFNTTAHSSASTDDTAPSTPSTTKATLKSILMTLIGLNATTDVATVSTVPTISVEEHVPSNKEANKDTEKESKKETKKPKDKKGNAEQALGKPTKRREFREPTKPREFCK
jgi:hypothetical protein